MFILNTLQQLLPAVLVLTAGIALFYLLDYPVFMLHTWWKQAGEPRRPGRSRRELDYQRRLRTHLTESSDPATAPAPVTWEHPSPAPSPPRPR